MVFSYFAHRRACSWKQEERRVRTDELSSVFNGRLSSNDNLILGLSVSQLVSQVHSEKLGPTEVLAAYSKVALKAHEQLNCLTEIMILAAETWAKDCNRNGSLAGVPVSLKDTLGVKGFDSSIGYSAWVGKPMAQDSAMVRLLRDAGAVPFVKTNVPITLLAFESNSDLFGRTLNPHNKKYSPGGSTGGEAALLAYGGSRLGIGTDVAGSVRIPAHYSGVYTIKSSVGRMPKVGSGTSIPGQEGVGPVYSPMARTLEDLETFWKAIVNQKPWDYDHTCLVMPWKELDLSKSSMRWGVMWDDGVILPSPACTRALKIVVDALNRQGQQVIAITPPSPYEGLKIACQLLFADAAKTVCQPMRFFESNDPGVARARFLFSLPRWVKSIYAWYLRRIRGDDVSAGLVESWHEQRITDYWPLVAQREAYRKKWFDMWDEQKLDFVLTVPNALPAIPHGGLKHNLAAYGYTFLFNLLDYSAGVLPITKVDAELDGMSKLAPRNGIERDTYSKYDSVAMHGLPVGVQVIGRRLEEEKVMEAMKLIQKVMKDEGAEYQLLDPTM
ncbi:amidase signature enzyme [Mycena floridula]|nr:amidase signature enzyme [Mycena floridula]